MLGKIARDYATSQIDAPYGCPKFCFHLRRMVREETLNLLDFGV
jgi:hypothetical protein